MTTATHASTSHSHDTSASAQAVWALFTDVSSWKEWNAGVHDCSIDGAFTMGSWLTMTLPDQEVIKSQLIDVMAPQLFTDETKLGDIVVKVRHEIKPLSGGGHRITFSIDVQGERALNVCNGISADFPDVLSALAARAEGRVAP